MLFRHIERAREIWFENSTKSICNKWMAICNVASDSITYQCCKYIRQIKIDRCLRWNWRSSHSFGKKFHPPGENAKCNKSSSICVCIGLFSSSFAMKDATIPLNYFTFDVRLLAMLRTAGNIYNLEEFYSLLFPNKLRTKRIPRVVLPLPPIEIESHTRNINSWNCDTLTIC